MAPIGSDILEMRYDLFLKVVLEKKMHHIAEYSIRNLYVFD